MIKAVAFDIDGTLYRNSSLNSLLGSWFMKNHRQLRAYGKIRKEIRALDAAGQWNAREHFFTKQGELLGRELGIDAIKAEEWVEKEIYQGWAPLFEYIPPIRYLEPTLAALKREGYKIAALSDFPPEQKLVNMGIEKYFNVILGAENIGYLKPSPVPFAELAKALDTAPNEILYVGDNVEYDIMGAKKAGMQAAYIGPCWAFLGKIRAKQEGACFILSNYANFMKKLKCIAA
ncbi:MAG: HAD family hydrolase [Spirochaetaceae bacterium]|jgi:putative hydrolase of the HAD superfamily|nr:HAD family hydrolase [Spirochaetaceae bacterium]